MLGSDLLLRLRRLINWDWHIICQQPTSSVIRGHIKRGAYSVHQACTRHVRFSPIHRLSIAKLCKNMDGVNILECFSRQNASILFLVSYRQFANVPAGATLGVVVAVTRRLDVLSSVTAKVQNPVSTRVTLFKIQSANPTNQSIRQFANRSVSP